MSENKFTPGEWKIKPGNVDNGGGKFSITTKEWNIATIWVTGDDEETANAKLIAAAPELVKRLQLLAEFASKVLSHPEGSKGYDPIDKMNLQDQINKSLATIQKATS